MTGKIMNMRRHSYTLVFAITLSLLASCSSSEELKQDIISTDDALSLSINSITLSPTGESQSITLTASDSWNLRSDASWLSISKSSGKEGTHQIVVSAPVNATREDRQAILEFQSEGKTKRIDVDQAFPYIQVQIMDKDGNIAVKKDSVHFSWNESRQSSMAGKMVHIKSNIDWKIGIEDAYGASNFIFSKTEGNGNADITLLPDVNNLDRIPFDGKMKVLPLFPDGKEMAERDGINSFQCQLRQKNLRFLLNNECNDMYVTIDELNKYISNGSISVDSELPWSIEGLTDWVSVSRTSGPAGVTDINIGSKTVNPTLLRRDRDIILKSTGGAERVIHVTQDPYIFELGAKSKAFSNGGGEETTVHLLTTGTWEITDIPSWLKVSSTSGEGNANITFSCPDQNLQLEDLMASVTFKSKLNTITDTFSVSQDRFLFNVTPSDELSKIPTFSTTGYDIAIESSGSWSVSVDQTWVNLSSKSGSGSKSIKANATSENPDINRDRTATITITSETHKGKGISLTRKVTMLQRRFVFDVTIPKTSIPAYTRSTFDLNIDCSAQWEITSHPNWMTPEVTKGEAGRIVRFTIAANTDKSNTRSGKITVKSLYNNQTKTTATITQDKFVFDIDKSSFTNITPVGVTILPLNVTCTEEAGWMVTRGTGAWISATSDSGNGNGTILFRTEDNPLTSSRSATVTIQNIVSNEEKTISFSQKGYEFSSSAQSSYTYGELETKSNSFNLVCSGQWVIEVSNGDWLHFSSLSGTGNSNITFYPEKNTTKTDRRAVVTVYSTLQKGTANELKSSFEVKQEAYKFDQTTESVSYEALNDNQATSSTVAVTCSGGWKVSDVPAWISVAPSTGTGNGIVTLTPSTNTGLESRSATISIISTDNNSLKKEIRVSQNPYVFSIDKSTEKVTSAETKVEIKLKSSSAWTALSNQTWAKLDKGNGSGNATITLTVSKNTSSAREATVTFRSDHNHTLTFTLSQSK